MIKDRKYLGIGIVGLASTILGMLTILFAFIPDFQFNLSTFLVRENALLKVKWISIWFISSLLPIIFIISGIGVLCLKEWARKLTLSLGVFTILTWLIFDVLKISLIKNLILVSALVQYLKDDSVFIWAAIIYVFSLLYLTRPKIKNLFTLK